MLVNKRAEHSFIDQSIGIWGHSFHFFLSDKISADKEVFKHSIFMIVHSYTEGRSLDWDRSPQAGISEGLEEKEEIEGNFSAVKERTSDRE